MKRVIFCATPRTGSTMIFDDFRNVLGQEPVDSEILYQEIINKRTEQDWPGLWHDIQEPWSVGPVWAVKVMFHYVPYLSQFIAGERLTRTPPVRSFAPERFINFMRFFEHATWVHVRRRDVFAQAVSMYMAESTDIWENRTGSDLGLAQKGDRPPYDLPHLLTYVEDLMAERRQWTSLFAHFGIEPLSIDYEDAASQYPEYLSLLLRHLELQALPAPPPRRLFKVGDELNEAFARRLQADYEART